MRALLSRLEKDPRYAQLLVLGSLLLYGIAYLDFSLPALAVPLTVGFACLVERLQFRWRRAPDRPRPPYESAAISALSTLLLLRSTEVWVYLAVVLVAVLSKSLIRIQGRHFVNPTNGAVLFGAAFLPAWITNGQWGHGVLFAFLLGTCGWLVTTRAGRLDSALAFLGGLLFFGVLRTLIFGYRWPVLLHLFENGALWLFAFYMVTDPRTTPDRRAHRVLHAVLVAGLTMTLIQFFYVRDSFLWALLALAPLVPALNWLTLRTRRSQAEPTSGGPNVVSAFARA